MTLAVEGTGAVILTAWWLREFPLPSALMFGVFHAVSAFNNAGFSLFSDSLARYVADPVVSLTVAGLFLLGGIGTRSSRRRSTGCAACVGGFRGRCTRSS